MTQYRLLIAVVGALVFSTVLIISQKIAVSGPSDPVYLNYTLSDKTGIKSVPSLASLRGITVLEAMQNPTVYLAGYASVNDGGQGIWNWNPRSVVPDNTGTVVTPFNSTGAGRWVRQTEGYSYSAAWFGAVGDGATANATRNLRALQAGVNAAWENRVNFYIPTGKYYIDGTLQLPIRKAGYDYRGDSFRIFGAGNAPAFVNPALAHGTIIATLANAPVLKFTNLLTSVLTSVPKAGTGSFFLDSLRFEGNTSTPILYFDNVTEYSHLRDFDILQSGPGDGLRCEQCYKVTIERANILGATWYEHGDNPRTGTGVFMGSQYDGGLLTLRKVSSRGWYLGFKIGDGNANLSGGRLEQTECSNVVNGIWISPKTGGFTIEEPYFEAVSGTAVLDQGVATKVRNGWFYDGFTVGIDSTALAYGSTYEGNYLETSGSKPATLITITSSGRNGGGPSKTVSNNHLLFSRSGAIGVGGVRGLLIRGESPRINFTGNAFLPRGQWYGTNGTRKIEDQSTGEGIYGNTTTVAGEAELPTLSNGAISLGHSATLTDLDVRSGLLGVPGGSLFAFDASKLVNVSAIDAGNTNGRFLVFKVSNSNLTFKNSERLLLNGGKSFTGPGTIVFLTQNAGTEKYALEISRSNY
jgi:hypothetical protein